MKPFNVMINILLLMNCMSAQDLPYEHYLDQIEMCPKECHCPRSFPIAVYCHNKGLKSIPAIPSHTWYLYLQNNLIESVLKDALRNATQLRWLSLNHNMITSEKIDVGVLEGLPKLVHLFMEDNLLSSIPTPLPITIEQLHLSRNRISKIPPGVFAPLNQLVLLDLQGNKLQDDAVTETSLKGLTNLVQLNMAKNDLRSMPPGLPASTTQLFLDNNRIEKIAPDYLTGLPNLAFLRLNHNKLTNAGLPTDLFNLSSLLEVQMTHNQLTEVPHIPPGLEQLYLNHNHIKRLNVSKVCPVPVTVDEVETVPRLRYLRLDGNAIKPPVPMELMKCFRLLRAVVI